MERQFSKWFSERKKAMEKDHANFVKQYENLTQGFMDEQATEWNKWFEEKKTELCRGCGREITVAD